jgi:hypothetical protein
LVDFLHYSTDNSAVERTNFADPTALFAWPLTATQAKKPESIVMRWRMLGSSKDFPGRLARGSAVTSDGGL